ncbi:sulfate adenylyltransferase [Methanohalobium evestigatum Z-7303]|uniref:Sulfate adenylyltransferase n=1 Tax=Methanohalobium evestigatum (strain ATCC BAA-1072 / DSM 3721 / NBRC 107634 / OCM 161 / Z-7303) TaxID=644295 RepID=D7E8V7_METEZ|nr:sulfate adenylyltransferase [Methanohalobium evestigatum]ADI73778.1 sulfate adenylyltransferase [Methanohalobium evestigatum Z-7303]
MVEQQKPHGGKLIDRTLSNGEAEDIINRANDFQSIEIGPELVKDVENIASGLFSPLEGFLTSDDYERVLYDKRLSSGIPWTIPIVLDLSKEKASNLNPGDEVLLRHNNQPVALLNVDDVYKFNKRVHCEQVFGTTDDAHPGVAKIYQLNDRLVGGKINLLNETSTPFYEYALKPAETRSMFKEKDWEKVVGFQTRNVPHLGHEFIQKTALSLVDGLFINPVIGRKKSGDFKDNVILDSYESLIENYFPQDRATLGIFQTEMRYAGPREAIFHAIVRKNFGCTHFIVGRDHAGVGSFYHPFAAHEIFSEFDEEELGITPIFFKSFFYCKKCRGIANDKTCPHSEEQIVNFSGTRMREMLTNGERPPADSMRPEVADSILKYENPFVE